MKGKLVVRGLPGVTPLIPCWYKQLQICSCGSEASTERPMTSGTRGWNTTPL